MASHVALVQRHADERTQAAGLLLAAQELPFTATSAVSAGPFPDTLRASLRWAANQAADWVVALDADVLVLPSSLRRGIKLAERYPKTHFVITACVLDKFFGTVRPAGVRFYRRSLIDRALESNAWLTQIRPETALLQWMHAQGHPSADTALLAGVHDHEQYYRDLYRTAVVHGVKFRDRAERNIRRWSQLAPADDDYRVMMLGAEAGLALDSVKLDAAAFHGEAEDALASLGLDEKPPLEDETPPDAERFIDPRLDWLRDDRPLARHFPHFALKMAVRPDQPRRIRVARLAIAHRRLLLRRAPIER